MAESKFSLETLALSKLSTPPETQMRARVSQDVINRYAEQYENGEEMEPIDVWGPDENEIYIVGDGHQRVAAKLLSRGKTIHCRVHKGGLREAMLFAAGSANTRHGVPLTEADRFRKVVCLLEDKDWGKKGAEPIARHAHVNKAFVLHVKKELKKSKGEKVDDAPKRTGTARGGRPRKDGSPAQPRDTGTRSMPAATASKKGLDDYGQTIPKDLLPAAYDGDSAAVICHSLSELEKEIEGLCNSDGGKLITKSSVLSSLKSAREGIERTTFCAVCPGCIGGGKDGENKCQHCDGRGWLSKNGITPLPTRLQKILKEAKAANGKE